MADDATAYDGMVEGRYEGPDYTNLYVKIGETAGGMLTIPQSDLPSARVGDKVQVALFLRPESGEEGA